MMWWCCFQQEQDRGLWSTKTKLVLLPVFSLESQVVQKDWGGGMGLPRRSLSPVVNMPGTTGFVCALWCKLWKSIAKSSLTSRGEMANLPCRGIWAWWQMHSRLVWETGGKTRPTMGGFVLWRHSSFLSHFLPLLLAVSFDHLLLVVTVLPFMASSLSGPLLALLVHLKTGLTGTAHLLLQRTLPSSICRTAPTVTPASIPAVLALIFEGSDHRFPTKRSSWRGYLLLVFLWSLTYASNVSWTYWT